MVPLALSTKPQADKQKQQPPGRKQPIHYSNPWPERMFWGQSEYGPTGSANSVQKYRWRITDFR